MAERRGKRSASLDEAGAAASSGALYGIPELMRRAIAMGLSGFFFTEEAIRKALGEAMPKDLQDFAIEQSRRTRADFLERLSYEVGRTLENVDVAAVLQQLLEGRTLEVTARIRLRDEKETRSGGKPRFRVEVERDADEVPEDAE
jgi:hypothetical protein